MRAKKDFIALETRTRYQRRSKFGVKDTLNHVERLKKRVAKALVKQNILKKKKAKRNIRLYLSEFIKRVPHFLSLLKNKKL